MKKNAILMGVAVSGMLLAAGCASSEKSSSQSARSQVEGECHGINACKGKGDCGGKGYSCAGKNACKGKGWLKMTKDQCDGKGGKFKS